MGVGLDEDEFQLILKQNNSIFTTYQTLHSIYSIKDFSEAVLAMGDNKGTLQIEKDDISLKTKQVSNHFGVFLEH